MWEQLWFQAAEGREQEQEKVFRLFFSFLLHSQRSRFYRSQWSVDLCYSAMRQAMNTRKRKKKLWTNKSGALSLHTWFSVPENMCRCRIWQISAKPRWKLCQQWGGEIAEIEANESQQSEELCNNTQFYGWNRMAERKRTEKKWLICGFLFLSTTNSLCFYLMRKGFGEGGKRATAELRREREKSAIKYQQFRINAYYILAEIFPNYALEFFHCLRRLSSSCLFFSILPCKFSSCRIHALLHIHSFA